MGVPSWGEQVVLAEDHLAGSEKTRGGCGVPSAEEGCGVCAVDSDMALMDVIHQELTSSSVCC